MRRETSPSAPDVWPRSSRADRQLSAPPIVTVASCEIRPGFERRSAPPRRRELPFSQIGCHQIGQVVGMEELDAIEFSDDGINVARDGNIDDASLFLFWLR